MPPPVGSRVQVLRSASEALAGKGRPKVLFGFSSETAGLSYFPAETADDLARALRHEIEIVQDPGVADLVLVSAHGSDLSGPIGQLRRLTAAPVGAWFWDNHLAPDANLRTARACEFLFPSHWYRRDALLNPSAVVAGHVPACCAQFREPECAVALQRATAASRSGRLLVNYVDYPGTPRSRLFAALRAAMPEAEMLLMEPRDRRRYFGLDRAARLAEWLRFKTSLVVPVDRDLSTRLFDGLLAGHVPVVAGAVDDLDAVIAPADQDRLGIQRVSRLDAQTVREAHAEALRRFDAAGDAGVLERHRFVVESHMLHHRVLQMTRLAQGLGARIVLQSGALVASDEDPAGSVVGTSG